MELNLDLVGLKGSLLEGKGMQITFAVILLSLVVVLCNYKKVSKSALKKLKQFPGPSHKAIPIIGNLYEFAGPGEVILPKLTSIVEEYGPRVLMWFGFEPVILLADGKDIDKVLSSQVHHKGKMMQFCMKWLMGNGLVMSEDEMWRADRKIMAPAFKFKNYDGFLDTFNRNAKTFVDIIGKESTSEVKKGRDVHPELVACTMDSIIESSCGIPSDLQINPNEELTTAVEGGLESIRTRGFKPWLLPPIIWQVFGTASYEVRAVSFCKKFFLDLVRRRRIQVAEGKHLEEKSKPLMDVLIETRTEQHIFEHMTNLVTAGFETTASAINYTLYLLACYPECQAKALAEVDAVFENDRTCEATFGHLAELKYLEMCVKEAMRVYPPVPVLSRYTKSEVELDNGLVIPEGTELLILLYQLHRSKEVFPNPDEFDPDRFLPENVTTRGSATFFPFAAGPRVCIGQKYGMMQIKVVLSHILRNFTVSTTLERKYLKPIVGLVLENNVKVPLTFTERVSESL